MFGSSKAPTTKTCPFLGKPCIEHGCMLYGQILGKNPNTGADTDAWGCAIGFIPLLLIEGNRLTNGVGAAVESNRNETVNGLNKAAAMTAFLGQCLARPSAPQRLEVYDEE